MGQKNGFSIQKSRKSSSFLTNGVTIDERIAGVTAYTTADGIVINNSTFGVYAARAGTGIDTFLIRTRSISGTV